MPSPMSTARQNLRWPELGWCLCMGVGGAGDVGSGGWYAGGASSSGAVTDTLRKERLEVGELGCSVMIMLGGRRAQVAHLARYFQLGP